MTRIALLVDSPSKRAHGNAASRLALGLVESGEAEVDLVCYSEDPPPPWLPPEVRIHRLGVDRVSRSVPGLVRYLRTGGRTCWSRDRCTRTSWAWRRRGSPAPPRGGGDAHPRAGPPSGAHPREQPARQQVAREGGYRFADGLIAPSPTVLADTIEWCGLDPRRVRSSPTRSRSRRHLSLRLRTRGCGRRAPGVRERDEPAPVQAGGPADRRVRPTFREPRRAGCSSSARGRAAARPTNRSDGSGSETSRPPWDGSTTRCSTSPAPGPWSTRRTRTASRRSSPRR